MDKILVILCLQNFRHLPVDQSTWTPTPFAASTVSATLAIDSGETYDTVCLLSSEAAFQSLDPFWMEAML